MKGNDQRWDTAVAAVRAYATRTGNTLPPASERTSDGRQLKSWANIVRAFYRRGKLSAERVEQLEQIPGWVWRTRARRGSGGSRPAAKRSPRPRWTDRIEEVEAYIAEHGMLPSHRSPDLAERSMRAWLSLQARRARNGRLSADRSARVLLAADPALTPEWRHAFNRACSDYGTPRACQRHRWIKDQEKQARQSRLSSAQQQLLATIPKPYLTGVRGRPPKRRSEPATATPAAR